MEKPRICKQPTVNKSFGAKREESRWYLHWEVQMLPGRFFIGWSNCLTCNHLDTPKSIQYNSATIE